MPEAVLRVLTCGSVDDGMRWSPKTGQVAKRESPFGTAGGRR
jgi:hypothetical protein